MKSPGWLLRYRNDPVSGIGIVGIGRFTTAGAGDAETSAATMATGTTSSRRRRASRAHPRLPAVVIDPIPQGTLYLTCAPHAMGRLGQPARTRERWARWPRWPHLDGREGWGRRPSLPLDSNVDSPDAGLSRVRQGKSGRVPVLRLRHGRVDGSLTRP